jgi:hypothetical protein
MALYPYIHLADKLLEEVHASGTTILAATEQGKLRVAMILKMVRDEWPAGLKSVTKGPPEPSTEPFDALAWWDPLHENRIVASLVAEGYGEGGSSQLDSTGEYAGVMLQQVMGKSCRLIVQVRPWTRPDETQVQAFVWRDDLPQDDLPQNVGYKEITWDGKKILAAVSVTESDRAILEVIAASPAMQVALIPGTRPQEFRLDDQLAAAGV